VRTETTTTRAPVMVGIPCVDWMWTAAAIAQRDLMVPQGSTFEYPEGATTLVHKRNLLAEAFIQREGFSHILMLDSDMVPPADALLRLLAHGLPIVGALCFQRITPFSACAGWFAVPNQPRRFLTEAGGPQPLHRVDWIGTGCLLIEREALLQVPKPWFDWLKPGQGEDTWFSIQATKAKIPIHCDTGFSVGHIGVTSVDLQHVMAWQRTAEARRLWEEAHA
jgi:hypothetical protein